MNNQIFIKTFVELYNEFEYCDAVNYSDHYENSQFIKYTFECLKKLMSSYKLSPMAKIIILAGIHREVENEDVKNFLEFEIDVIQTFLD